MSLTSPDSDGFGPDDIVRMLDVSRETLRRVDVFLGLLDVWRTRINLIGPGEGSRIWRRHVLDSLQILPDIRPEDELIADLGTGAGFPGLVLACVLAERHPGVRFYLVEKSPRKSAFLQAVVREARLKATVLTQRIEDGPPQRVDLLTARALAPLPELLDHASAWLQSAGRGLFLKGRSAEEELAAARQSWQFEAETRPSLSGPDGQVLTISSPMRRTL